jgi:hypothetical protein
VLNLRSAPRRGLAAGLTCPYCKDALESVASCVECESCGTWLHDECFRENQGCTVLGCREQRSRKPPVRIVRAASRVPAPPEDFGLTELAVVLAFVHGSALGSIAGVVSAIGGYAHSPGQAGCVAFLAASVFVVLRLAVGYCGATRRELAPGDRLLCILSGLVTGLVGVPLVFFSLVS